MILLLLILDSETDRTMMSDLFASNYHRMKRMAFGILGDASAAEDAVQDTFVRCIRRIDTLRDLPEKARAVYLMTAVKRNALNRLHSSGARVSVPVEEIELTDETATVEERVLRSLTVAEVRQLRGCRKRFGMCCGISIFSNCATARSQKRSAFQKIPCGCT